jgi:hypothetical protein
MPYVADAKLNDVKLNNDREGAALPRAGSPENLRTTAQ